jgi:hypothetical protein
MDRLEATMVRHLDSYQPKKGGMGTGKGMGRGMGGSKSKSGGKSSKNSKRK